MQLFNEIDTDNSGYITADEVVNMYQKLGVSVTMVEAKKIVAESDTDKDGQISFDGNLLGIIENPKPNAICYAITNFIFICLQNFQSHCTRGPSSKCMA